MLTFTNKLNQSIEFKDGTSFRLFSITGLDDAPIENNLKMVGFQDGAILQGSRYEPRVIELEFGIFATNKEHLLNLKRRLTDVFNSGLGLGTIIHSRYNVARQIKAKIESGPYYPNGGDNETEQFQRGTLSLICPDPFWKNVNSEERVDIAAWVPSFSFPLNLQASGVVMGYRTISLFVNVANDGQKKTGMTIKMKANTPVENPSILNVNTNEYIKLSYTLEAGEEVIITTHQNNKRVTSIKNGERMNIFTSVEHGSRFLQLAIGDNIFKYDADVNHEGLDVAIYHEEMFVGV